jgi:ADP-ribose pyrophosphatase YjhB (NUDIX family)
MSTTQYTTSQRL